MRSQGNGPGGSVPLCFLTTESQSHGENPNPVKSGRKRLRCAIVLLCVSVTPWWKVNLGHHRDATRHILLRREVHEAFASKFFSMLDAIAKTLLWSGTEPFGVSLSTSPGRIWAIALPAVSGLIPALAASAFT